MRRVFLLLTVITLAVGAWLAMSAPAGTKEISLADLRDKIEGGWAGQMIGVSYGAPTEFRYRERIIPEKELPDWTPDKISNALVQDDLYVDMTFAKVLDDKGVNATTEDFGAMFREAKYHLWHANLAARRALKRGVPATLSGTPKYNIHANDIDFQIEADFVGLMAPGLPQVANDIAWRAGRVMNYGDGIYGGMFVGCMYAAGFFDSDPRRVVEAGLACIPAKSPYGRVIADVLAWSKESDDWIKVWNRVEEKWNKREPCPEGANAPFNIDAKLNGAYIAIGLLYGKGDMGETIRISTRCGQDSDCNPSSAAGILGVMVGYKKIDDHWKGGIPAIADKKFSYTDFSFRTIVDSNVKRAIALVERNGGRVAGDKLIVKTQAPRAAKLELWDDYGSPVERLASDDARWTFKGEWRTPEASGGRRVNRKVSATKGAEAAIAFEGTGAVIVGPYLPSGGKAEVWLDGKLDRVVDVYPDETHMKGGESVWHAFGLKNGKHTLRLVVLGEPYPGATGAEIGIDHLVVFR
ncbi:MAG: ADP-ribosylglycohydrolase family protein [Bryobacteraceae bacterium]|nr:ADP-ribosylglycohydrolase family protein [Bryobacteraceae bacterium]